MTTETAANPAAPAQAEPARGGTAGGVERRRRPPLGVVIDGRLKELLLYPGNFCNRDCAFCTVLGSPKGWYHPFAEAHLERALEIVHLGEDGALKFYGGEPTLDVSNMTWTIRYCRERGFRGTFTVFSNGIRDRALVEIVESDPERKVTVALNYSIWVGDGAEPIPAAARARLEAYARAHPGVITVGYSDIMDMGGGLAGFGGSRQELQEQFQSDCGRCYPVVTTRGDVHACPFAVEIRDPRFHLGDTTGDAARVVRNFQAFFRWIDDALMPFARATGLAPCTVCRTRLAELPLPAFEAE
jgi:MoaA/NifB/PqqE/SkfB family radical SAM enzyme